MERILRSLEADAAGLNAETRRRNRIHSMVGIVYTADARVEDPVLGAYGRVQKLRQELARLKAEHAARQQQQETEIVVVQDKEDDERSTAMDPAEPPSGAVDVAAAAEVTSASGDHEDAAVPPADDAAPPTKRRKPNPKELD
uniref:LOB domain-containing protein n=1 Tax=Leersia perrieri TaxID=77586 RepID=A0A0D9V270_9ORYZ